MPILQTVRGRIVDLCRHTNVHLYWRGRFGPAERYELWLRDFAESEHQFVVHTRTMPARRGHEVTLIVDSLAVRGIVNWSTGMRVNYLNSDPQSLLRLYDVWASLALFTGLVALLGDLRLLLFLPAVMLYFLLAVMLRCTIRRWHAATVERALLDVQGRDSARRYARQNRA